ncbi:cytochrome P450 [Actinophytocola gossypii]|uniref:Cytochrome P450 n=1 Tax=Actinophytocola gossypii TaxID=2812003 RepID=A0ABT2J2E5_9PSEU|nr:cytochrome P450 [Actinophytocola gossypii]MCT2582030.1 cytochrome P450 [Actinophytocola gossypii]
MTLPPGSALPAIVQTVRFLRDPTRVLEGNRRRYGPVFRMRLVGFPPEVFVATAAHAERIYRMDANGGRAGEVRRMFLEPIVGQQSLLSLDGDQWMRHRKLVNRPLHGRAIAGYRDEIADIAVADIERWPRGEPIDLRSRMQDITLVVILRLVFGIRDAARLARLRKLLPELADVAGSVALTVLPPGLRSRMQDSALLRRVRFLPTTRFVRLRAAVDEIVYDEIARRRATPDPEATDVLSRLLEARDEDGEPLSDLELRDELIALLEAGHETTATSLAWTFERLVRTPAVFDRLREELARDDEQYLDAVIKEALRVRPVVFAATRLLDSPIELGGHQVPAGWLAAPVISLVHRDPDVFPAPDEFRPERFLGEDAARTQKSWMPFGGGRRYCAGAQLALLEMRVIIREVLDRVTLTTHDPAPEAERIRHVTLVPARGGRVVAHDLARATC